jgi:microcystin-dependent protein
LTVEHDISDDATTSGFHGENVTGKAAASITTPPTGYGRFGWKVIAGIAELFHRDDAGGEVQVTSEGGLNSPPAGVISAYAGSSAPSGWLLCDGSEVSQTTYSTLFGVIGTTYDDSPGAGNFNVPDLVGYFVRGLDIAGVVDEDIRTLGSIQEDSFQGHKHSVTHNVHTGNSSVAGGGVTVSDNLTGTITIGNPTDDGTNGTPRTGTETRPKNMALNYIIKI